MPCLVSIPGIHPVWGKTTLKWIICPLWQYLSLLRCLATNSLQILTASETYLDGLMDQAQMPLCSCMQFSFTYWDSQLIRVSMSHTHSVCSVYHLDHDGCIKCHLHYVRCRNNTVTHLLACTEPSSTGQGQYHKDDNSMPTYIVQGVP